MSSTFQIQMIGLAQCVLAMAIIVGSWIGCRFFDMRPWLCWSLFAIAAITSATAYPSARFLYNAAAGCFPWSPAEVPYHPGMTLCPGQSTQMHVIIPYLRLAPLPPQQPIEPVVIDQGI